MVEGMAARGLAQDLTNAWHRIAGLEAEIKRLRKRDWQLWRVRNAREHADATDFGWCYSFYDHFDVHWDSGGAPLLGIVELSNYGIFKTTAAEAAGGE